MGAELSIPAHFCFLKFGKAHPERTGSGIGSRQAKGVRQPRPFI